MKLRDIILLKEFAPPSDDRGDDGFNEETLKKLAAQWYNGDEDPRVERTLMAAGWEIGQDEGYDNGGVFVVRAGDVNGNSYLSWPAEELQQGVAESTSTGDPVYIEGCDWHDVVNWLVKNVGPVTKKNPNYAQGWEGRGWILYPINRSDKNGKPVLQLSAATEFDNKQSLLKAIQAACSGQQGMVEGSESNVATLDAVFNEHDFYRLEHIWPALEAGDTKEALRQINHYLNKGKNRAWWGDLQALDIKIDPNDIENSQVSWSKPLEQGVAEAKSLKKHVRVVQGEHAGKTGWIREIKHGAFKGAPKRYYVDIDGGGQANNLPAEALRLIKDEQGVAESYQLDEGAMETISNLVKKLPGIGKYYQIAQEYKPQLVQILKTSKSGKEVKQKMETLLAQTSTPVAEAGLMKQLGGLALGGGSILSTMWMNAMGMIDGVLAHAAAGQVGGAVASGSILGLIPVTLMLFAAMLLFKGSKQSSDEKAQQFQAQRGQQGVAEGFNGISVDIEPELDYDVVYVNINGKKHNFNYWYSDEKPTNELEFRKDIPQYLKREEWYNKLDFPTKMEVLHAVVQAELGNEPSEYKPTVGDEPLDEQGVAEGHETNPVVNAITRRIMVQRPDLLKQYGPVAVGQAIDDVADFVGGVEEIGSSDVSGWVRHVEQMLQDNPPEAFGEADSDKKIAGRYDPDEFDQMVLRLKKLAGAGPLKTVYDPKRRVYKNVPTAEQPKK